MPSQHGTHMEEELREAPAAVSRQAQALAAPLGDLVARIERRPPQFVVTCARGSSAHAASFAKHLFERHLGLPVAAAAPNIASVYRKRLRLDGRLFLAVSQSGGSDDLVESAAQARASGALTIALVNATESPLAAACEIVLPIAAGPEQSVAATKTFVATLAAVLRWTALWSADTAMQGALDRLPERLAAAAGLDWGAACAVLAGATSLAAIGRGPTLAIAREAALKLKEICRLPAEAFSGAEFLHGPVALVDPGYPILVFLPTDRAAAGLSRLAADLRRKGAALFATDPCFRREGAPYPGRLPALAADHPEADAICLAASFYALVLRVAAARGTEIDRPRHLQKVTRTR
ncbi:MAG TPA: SIS domain-containing protein [Stellaceae bacterium]|nr:SIS domain-containing protein [Stellaceae bacterium]